MAKITWMNWFKKTAHRLGFLLSGILLNSRPYRRWVTNQFHKLIYGSYLLERPWTNTKWLGVPVLKCPFDLWVYQEMIYDLQPDVIIESGTFKGGSALYLAMICELIGKGRVVSIDLNEQIERPKHARLSYLHGSSIDPQVVNSIKGVVAPEEKVLVFLDSTHEKVHVLAEMRAYSPFVSLGSYMVVEDTNLNGFPVWHGYGPGPREAVQAFLAENDSFAIDRECEKYYLSFNPGGFLRRVK